MDTPAVAILYGLNTIHYGMNHICIYGFQGKLPHLHPRMYTNTYGPAQAKTGDCSPMLSIALSTMASTVCQQNPKLNHATAKLVLKWKTCAFCSLDLAEVKEPNIIDLTDFDE